MVFALAGSSSAIYVNEQECAGIIVFYKEIPAIHKHEVEVTYGHVEVFLIDWFLTVTFSCAFSGVIQQQRIICVCVC